MGTITDIKKEVEAGDVCILEYEDAVYYDVDIQKIEPRARYPKIVKTAGMIRSINDEYIDISLVWSEKKEDIFFHGLVIPMNTVKKIILLAKHD